MNDTMEHANPLYSACRPPLQVEKVEPSTPQLLAVHSPHDRVIVDVTEGIDDRMLIVNHGRRDHPPELDFSNLRIAKLLKPNARTILSIDHDGVDVVHRPEVLASPF